MKRKLTMGTDVEVGLFHHERQMMIPCTYVNTPEDSDNRGTLPNGSGTFHRDNILMEAQSNPVPIEQFYVSVTSMRDGLYHLLNSRGTKPVYRPWISYPDRRMTKCPESQERGCASDFCAYTGVEHFGPDEFDPDGRGAGGHWHVGGVEDYSEEEVRNTVKLLDIYLALLEADYLYGSALARETRRTYYGQFGRFRYKAYGFEYRAPDNQWLLDSDVMNRVTRSVSYAVALTDTGVQAEDIATLEQVKSLAYGQSDTQHIVRSALRKAETAALIKEA